MTIDDFQRMADDCAADKSNARRMMGGRYAQRAARAIRHGDLNLAKREMVDAMFHWHDFARWIPDELEERHAE